MKPICIITLLLYVLAVSAQSSKGFALEDRGHKAIYLTKESLNLPESSSKIKVMKQINGFNSVQVNTTINGNNIVGDAANEPSIAVNSLNPNQIAIGWRQFNTVTNSFRQAGRSYSSDGGVTWNYQEVFEPGVFRSDPVLASNADGHFYYQSLRVDLDSQGDYTNFNVDQWKSYDGGVNWVEKTFAYGGDKSWIVVDKTDESSRGNIYAAWNLAGNQYSTRTFNLSLNNGFSYNEPISIPRSPIFGGLDVGPDGELYIFGISNFIPPRSLGDPYLIKSTNPNSLTPIFTQFKHVNMDGNIGWKPFINPEGLAGQLYVKVDKSNRDSRGNVYVLGSVTRSYFYGDPLDVIFRRSTDGGLTFDRRKIINTDTSKNWQWFSALSVAPNGRIDVIWYDTRNDDGTQGNGRYSRMFYSFSNDGGLTFAKEEALTERFDNLIGYPVQQKMGDYIDMESDNLGAHIAYTATFNGEQDVYYLYAKPSAIEENPDFPTLLTNNAWAVSGVPSQGILASTLINNGNPDNPLLSFEAIFTAKPDGTPIWLVATGEIPLEGDSYTIPLYMPTGDLSENGKATLAIGTMTKKRLRDENGDLIDNKIEYEFDMSNGVKENLQSILGEEYDETFFNTNPFHGIQKTLGFDSLLPRAQLRKDLCNINSQVLVSQGEKSEGRLQYSFLREGVLELFAADFTYKKTIVDGMAVLNLDENGLAIPTWEVIQADAPGILPDNSVTNKVSTPNGGLGFFQVGDATGVTGIGTENVVVNGSQLITTKPNTLIETMSVIANNAYCGELL